MNSLNLLSSRVIGQSKSHPSRQRSHSQGEIKPGTARSELPISRSYSEDAIHNNEAFREKEEEWQNTGEEEDGDESSYLDTIGEKTPLLQTVGKDDAFSPVGRLQSIAQRIFETLTETLKVILSTLVAPGVYVARWFRDDDGRYTPIAPVRKIRRSITRHNGRAATPQAAGNKGRSSRNGSSRRSLSSSPSRTSGSRESISSTTSESEADRRSLKPQNNVSKHGRSRSHNVESLSEDGTQARRSIRIKLHNEEALKKRKQRRAQSEDTTSRSKDKLTEEDPASLAADSLKSPTSPSSHKITKYPHSPTPPRPLIPPRQPSYAPSRNPSAIPQKTLVLDLDETLIHSLAKGGRMSSGHMVEVKLAAPVTTSTPGGVSTTVGPQHPILYYVHKRPHCDDFLRKVCKWYKLVVFTASVQEYAEPVIDWLERERKYFQGRYFRQHCTLRNGAYIKDLSSVEPDLSKVIILDNSPMSYIFHEGMLVLMHTQD